MHKQFKLTMTLKIHIILEHYLYYFEKIQQTFKDTSDEFTESAHSTLRKFEETHGCQTVKNLGTPIHMSRSLRSHTQFNSTHVGSSVPTRLRRKATPSPRSSSPSLSPSSPSTRIFSKAFQTKYPDAVQEHINRFSK